MIVLVSTFEDSPWKVVSHLPTEAVIENNERNVVATGLLHTIL
jgi:hypothetical protein